MMPYQVIAERQSDKPGQKIILRVEYPSYSEAWLSTRKWADDGWQILDAPTPVQWPTLFPLENAA